MKSNQILEEVWRIKDELAREAGYDIHRLCENTRKWAREHPHAGRVIHSAEELRQLVSEEERKRAEAYTSILKDEPPRRELLKVKRRAIAKSSRRAKLLHCCRLTLQSSTDGAQLSRLGRHEPSAKN